jgi:hypothetical protein
VGRGSADRPKHRFIFTRKFAQDKKKSYCLESGAAGDALTYFWARCWQGLSPDHVRLSGKSEMSAEVWLFVVVLLLGRRVDEVGSRTG